MHTAGIYHSSNLHSAPHHCRSQAVMCEIDQRVVEVSKQFFGTTMATAFNDSRATVHYMDAAIYMKEHQNEFDVIIVDSSDPVGPAGWSGLMICA